MMLSTYASPTAIKYLLLTINSLIFTAGVFILLHGTVQMIGVEGIATPYAHPVNESTLTVTIHGGSQGIDHKHHEYHSIDVPIQSIQDRFPSVGSASVLFLLGILIMGSSSLGITAVHLDDPALLDTFGYVSFISCFIKVLFLVATTQMHAFHYDYNPLNSSAITCLFVAILEIVLGMCSCQLARLLKRGEPEPEIHPLPDQA